MRKFDKVLVCASAAIFLSGCATSNSPEDLGKLEYTGFSEKSDGTAFQSVLGLTCPAEIDGINRTSTNVYNDQGTDASCNYSNNERILTVYLSHFPSDNLEGNFRMGQYHIENRFKPMGYEYDEELSDQCSAESLDETAFISGLSGLLSGQDKSNQISISSSPSAVYKNVKEGKMTLLVVEEMLEKEFFKVRFTGPYSGKNSVEETCKLVRATYLSMKQGVEKDRGIEVSKEQRLIDLINASEDKDDV